jgi:hypothetical protein
MYEAADNFSSLSGAHWLDGMGKVELDVQTRSFGDIVDFAARPIMDHIHFLRQVTEIDYSQSNSIIVKAIEVNKDTISLPYSVSRAPSGPPVSTATEDKHLTFIYHAKRVIVTVPLGVLKSSHLTFHPRLPKWKQDAIELLGFGVVSIYFSRGL